MGRVYSENEKKLHKKLIPYNIVICVIAIACIFSIMFAPIIRVDLGKMLRNDEVIVLLNETIEDAIGENGGLGGSGGEADDSGFSLADIDVTPIVSAVVTNVFSGINARISITAQGAAKVLNAPEGQKAKVVLDELLLGDAFMGQLIDSVVDSISSVFTNEETKGMIEEALISTVANTVASSLAKSEGVPDEIKNIVTEQNITNLTNTLKQLENLPANATADDVADEFVNQINDIFESSNLIGADVDIDEYGDVIHEFIVDGYNKTVENNNGKFSLEAFICITISETGALDGIDISDMFGSITGSTDGNATLMRAVAGEANTGDEPKIITSYADLLKSIGLDDSKMDDMKANIKSLVEGMVEEAIGESDEYFGYYGYLYYAMLLLCIPWIFLAALSFLHIFIKNKRITLWYVKLFGWIPAIFWLALTIGKIVVNNIGIEAETLAIVNIVLGGVSSFMWLCGLFYLIIWVLSIFWAFPIKRKIKKERKLAKSAA